MRSERDKPTTPCALVDTKPSDAIWSLALQLDISFLPIFSHSHSCWLIGAIILEVRSIVTMESVERRDCHSVYRNGLAVSEGTTVLLVATRTVQKKPTKTDVTRNTGSQIIIGGARSCRRCPRLRTEKQANQRVRSLYYKGTVYHQGASSYQGVVGALVGAGTLEGHGRKQTGSCRAV